MPLSSDTKSSEMTCIYKLKITESTRDQQAFQSNVFLFLYRRKVFPEKIEILSMFSRKKAI